jgi:hypothetical protein
MPDSCCATRLQRTAVLSLTQTVRQQLILSQGGIEMGSWGIGFFDNDTACDWGYELAGSADLSIIEKAFDKVLQVGEEYLESPDAEEALAAAEVVARLQGNWGPRNSYTETVDTWVDKIGLKVSEDVVTKAKAVIKRVVTAPSELLELWKASSEFEAWKTLVEQLGERVTA